jgi:RNA polymerase sigma-70 factor (ECF subfamily)
MVMIAAMPNAVGTPVEGTLEPETPREPEPAVPEQALPERALPERALPEQRALPGQALPERALPEHGLIEPARPESVMPPPGDWELPSWEDIVRAHSARVYRLAYRLTGNCHDAEDLTQEVFVRVFRSLSSYTPGTFEGWLHRITTNLFLDSARRKQRIRFEVLPTEVEQKLPGNEQTPAQAFDDRHFEGDVQAALMSLPVDYRAAVALCDIEGFSYEEIAATLGVKLGTVRSRIHRGRAQLRESLAHREPSHGKAGHGKGGES